LVARAARGGEEKQAVVISADRAENELDKLVRRSFEAKDGEKVLEWSVVVNDGSDSKVDADVAEGAVRARVRVLPVNQTFSSDWMASENEAKAVLVQRVLRNRLGAQLGNARSIVHEVVDRALGRNPSLTFNETAFPVGPNEVNVVLPDGLFEGGSGPGDLVFEGEGATTRDRIQSVALKALLYICAYISLLPPLKKLSETSPFSKTKLRRGTNRVVLKHLSPDTSADSVREQLAQFGTVEDLALKEGSGEGSATYEHRVSAWIAERMLHRSALDDRIISVEQEQEKVKAAPPAPKEPAASKKKESRTHDKKRTPKPPVEKGTPKAPKPSVEKQPKRPDLVYTSRDCMIKYEGAYEATYTEMREHFAQVGHVVVLNYRVDQKTGMGNGKGYVMFGSPEAASEAMKKLQDLKVKGRLLKMRLGSTVKTSADGAAAPDEKAAAPEKSAAATDEKAAAPEKSAAAPDEKAAAPEKSAATETDEEDAWSFLGNP